MNIIKQDRQRGGAFPIYQKFFRKANANPNIFYRILLKISCKLYHTELNYKTIIGAGLYIGHPYGITINANAKLGCNINIHKGVTIGAENRGKRKGCPQIGNEVWIGVNSTIVGNIIIGDDVLIAPNSFVNMDIPSHSIVYGNPCIIKSKENATFAYISNSEK